MQRIFFHNWWWLVLLCVLWRLDTFKWRECIFVCHNVIWWGYFRPRLCHSSATNNGHWCRCLYLYDIYIFSVWTKNEIRANWILTVIQRQQKSEMNMPHSSTFSQSIKWIFGLGLLTTATCFYFSFNESHDANSFKMRHCANKIHNYANSALHFTKLNWPIFERDAKFIKWISFSQRLVHLAILCAWYANYQTDCFIEDFIVYMLDADQHVTFQKHI